jgi:TolA-binding protein
LQQVVVPLAALPIDETPIVNKERVSLLRHAPADAGPPRAEQDFGAELSLYGQAHALHFGGGAAAPALDAWGRYLHEYPKGALSAEARFNEAVCLLKLGRRMEARRRLQSLVDADAAPSSARSQARELLLALGGAATVP